MGSGRKRQNGELGCLKHWNAAQPAVRTLQTSGQRSRALFSGAVCNTISCLVIVGLGTFATAVNAELLDPTGRTMRPGDKSVETVVRTDERYGAEGLFQGPRGWGYWNYLSKPRPIQDPNLWPDMQSTYFIGQFELPPGARMVMKQAFPHSRYFQLALYVSKDNTFVSNGESVTGPDIAPDSGAINPFVVGNRRESDKRGFTLTVLAEDPPGDATKRTANTLYAVLVSVSPGRTKCSTEYTRSILREPKLNIFITIHPRCFRKD